MCALHTQGHTPGALCLYIDGALISEERLLTLPDGSLVLQGHGGDTTIGASREEYAAFKNRPRPDDLHGHVSWRG